MKNRRRVTPWLLSFVAGLASLTATTATAQSTQTGFALNRYEPTAAGEWSFWVDHPWYSSTRYFAAGITLNYGHNPLVFGVDNGTSVEKTVNVIEHQLLGHVDLAGSFLDRVLITATLPVTLLERGTPAGGVEPTQGVVVGDPRVGLWLRLFGQPYRSGISMSIGANAWVPLRQFTSSGVSGSSSDSHFRVMPKLVLGGLASRFMWSLTGGFLYRAPAQIGTADPKGSTVGSEIQIGLALAYADTVRRFAIGPEALLSTTLLGNDTVQPKPFTSDYTSLELLLGLHYNIARTVNIGLAGGMGLLRTPGTPDFRGLFRLAYAPIRKEEPLDRDRDGIPDVSDACPDVAGISSWNAKLNGCPDRDKDGVVDQLDMCPTVPAGLRPDPNQLGCPIGDRDKDGVIDPDDLCPDVHKGERPDPARNGCPMGDRDQDGVLDADDLCPDTHKGANPDPVKLGCPAEDRDGDGVFDYQDRCPEVPQGARPDPNQPGCPLPDRDKDTVPDPVDACPDTPGAPHPDAKKNGCPGLVEVKGGQLIIVQPVFFATNRDVILAKSFPVLQSVADALTATPAIRKLSIQGHTDDRGKHVYNVDLSARRAKSVLTWLTTNGGIAADRLESQGFGPDKSIADNATPQGREKNRRVEFLILDPASGINVKVLDANQVSVPDSPDQSDQSTGKLRGR